jgi:alkaline phosphatase D
MRAKASNPFTLGVASGYPQDDSIVLWTRLAPDPLSGGGMGTAGDVKISLEIATDSSFTNTIQHTQAVAEEGTPTPCTTWSANFSPTRTASIGSPTRAIAW